MKAMPLGFFQFNNLVKGFIPFVLVHDSLDFSDLYTGRELEFMLRNTIELASIENAAALALEVKARKIPDNFPIIVICADGSKSTPLAHELDSLGFINSFYIIDGKRGLQFSP